MTSVLDVQSNIVLLGKGDTSLDIGSSSDVDNVAGVVTQTTRLGPRSERVASVVLEVHVQELSGRIDAEIMSVYLNSHNMRFYASCNLLVQLGLVPSSLNLCTECSVVVVERRIVASTGLGNSGDQASIDGLVECIPLRSCWPV